MIASKSFSKVFSILFFLVCGLAASVSAQAPVTSSTPSCPYVTVYSPDSVKAGEKLTMTVNVSGGDASVTPTYNWIISAGTIESGQGTSTVTIDTKGLSRNSSITGTVDVGGYDRSCSTSQSSTTMITVAAEARKFDEFGKISAADQSARLDNLALEMQNDATAQGGIIVYAGRKSKTGEAQRTADAAKNYLVKNRKIEAARIAIVDGGFREELTTELWIVPAGATPPAASPTVDPSEIKFAKKAPAKKAKRKKA